MVFLQIIYITAATQDLLKLCIFSCSGLTLIALLFSPKLLKKEILNDQENEEILKLCNGKPIYLPQKKKKQA